jgi:DNA-binding NtrC family response regulator
MKKPVILIVEDDRDGCRSVKEAIEDAGFEAAVAMKGEDGVQMFRDAPADVVLTDLVLPDIDGLEVLSRIRKLDSQVPILIMTAYGSVSSAVQALKSGAYDYITKPLDLDDLQSKIARALETHRLRSEVEQLHQSIHERYGVSSIVARSAGMLDLIAQVRQLADTHATVLITGESGTGKELVARALHVEGKRANGPFVAVNCGAFTETLLESELFGHERGAFTGAAARHKGAFERADGGTLLLDEIGDAPKPVQVKLLRVLEERELVRVGGQETVRVDVRVVSASNQDLGEKVASGEFREDLLYRLKVVTMHIPPLRERREDVRPLVDRFVAMACREHGRHIQSVSAEFYEVLEKQEWPGNVRQLKNVVESSVVMATGTTLTAGHVRLDDRKTPDRELIVPDGMTMDQFEKEALSQMLRRYEGNRTLVAEKLGISRRTIQRKIKDYNLPF